MNRISIVSGAFDPFYAAHMQLIKAARDHGHVLVLLNSDDWIIRNIGKLTSTWQERKEILHGITAVIEVWSVDDKDNTVCAGLQDVRARFPTADITFCNGGLRWTENNLPETATCECLNIKTRFNVGPARLKIEKD